MRLLNTTTLKLTEFNGAQIPRYAILSHTWEKEEVLFADIHSRQVTENLGYSKVCGCCLVARKRGLEWVWIDTCCIDKSSSSELSEAINSMYRWYAGASVCLVYLYDVEHDKKDMGDSRWFTRGWTLQELLAPTYIEFYTSKWEEIGTKTSLAPILSRITHIPLNVLRGQRPSSCSVAQRMSWAARRVTTREEDVAYCLLGLFDVNMPLLYGEGRRSFIRLQEQILRQEEDYSIFAWTADDPYQSLDNRLVIRSKEDHWIRASTCDDDSNCSGESDEFFDELHPSLPDFHTFYDITGTGSIELGDTGEQETGFLADSPAPFEGDNGGTSSFWPLYRLDICRPVQFCDSLTGIYQPCATNRLDQRQVQNNGFRGLEAEQITQQPPEVTVRGLRVTLPVISTGWASIPFLAWLYCYSGPHLICIPLRKTDKTSGTELYDRGYAHLLFAVDASLIRHFVLRQIFLSTQQAPFRDPMHRLEFSSAERSVGVTVEDESGLVIRGEWANQTFPGNNVLLGIYCLWSSPGGDSLEYPFMIFCGRVQERLWCAITEADGEAAERANPSLADILGETASSLYKEDPFFLDKADRLSLMLPQGERTMGVSIRENLDSQVREVRYTLHIGIWRSAAAPLWVAHAKDPMGTHLCLETLSKRNESGNKG